MKFSVLSTDRHSAARCGVLSTSHGDIPTPIFMPVGTRASVKSVEPNELKALDAKIILANTYHLYLKPGNDILFKAGGVHRFMNWDGPLLTDSGGYQVYSLTDLRKISEEGVMFKSHLDGSKLHFTPENVVDTQRIIGSDIMMPLDECPPWPAEKEYVQKSGELTLRWAERARKHFLSTRPHYGYEQFQFGITQGGTFDDLRAHSSRALVDMDFDGYAVGGMAVGEPAEEMYRMLELSHTILPESKPRYLMGVGTPANILNAIERGIDMFDCVIPTREGRNGRVYTRKGTINLRAGKYADDFRPIDEGFDNHVCRNYSRAYIRHLLNVGEILGLKLCTMQNLSFYLWLTRTAREHIAAGDFTDWKESFLMEFNSNDKTDERKPAIFLLSLGCSKNTVDSERLTAQAVASGLTFTDNVDEADIILINTCGFIKDAKQESIDETLAAIGKKEEGVVREVYVMGCLVELYRKELAEEMPEIDGLFGTRELPEVLAAIGAKYREELFDRRELLTPPHYAFLKIAEGCNRRCSFCSIPKIRGPYVSQPIEQLLREAALLQQQGVKELNLIAQDISVYGYDLYGKSALNDLTLRLSDMGFNWIRLLYAYPLNFPLEVISTMRERPNVCNYIDMPLQHINDRILKSMQRGIGRKATEQLIDDIRQKNPDIRLRTTMIAGYPGETRAEFEELLDFIRQTRFDRLGCFPYRHEEHASAYALEDTVSDEEKEKRVGELMELQEGISASLNRKLEGQTLKVLIDRIEESVAYARTEYDAPEVDNDVIIEIGDEAVEEGDFRQVMIEDSTAYELFGRISG